jgi:competence protein ComEA
MNRQRLVRWAVPLALILPVIVSPSRTFGQAVAAPKAATTKPAGLIDLNTATAKELVDSLDGVGEVTAKKIVDGRPYKSVDDLAKAGVPERTINMIRSKVTVSKPKAASRPAGAAKPAATHPSSLVNLNTATAAELETLPNVGPATAKAIIAGRPYASVDDLDKVKGIAKTKLNALRPLVTTEATSARPVPASSPTAAKTKAATKSKAAATTLPAGKVVNLNTASKAELEALFDIGPVKAQAIIDGRPYKSIDEIKNVKGIKDGIFAKIKDQITVK